jgi:hypothetical protein
MRDLAVVAEEQPATGKDLPLLLLIDFRLDEDPPAHDAAVVIHQSLQIREHPCLLNPAVIFAGPAPHPLPSPRAGRGRDPRIPGSSPGRTVRGDARSV